MPVPHHHLHSATVQVGMRFLIFEVHPMKVGATLMNSFLFNCALILMVSIAVTHFAAQSFAPYARDTAIDALFITYIEVCPTLTSQWPWD